MELYLKGYTVLEGVADYDAFSRQTLQDHRDIPVGIPNVSNSVLFNRIHPMFPGEDALRDESERHNWNPIINSGDEKHDEIQRDMGVARYSTTKHFLMETLETTENVDLAERRA